MYYGMLKIFINCCFLGGENISELTKRMDAFTSNAGYIILFVWYFLYLSCLLEYI